MKTRNCGAQTGTGTFTRLAARRSFHAMDRPSKPWRVAARFTIRLGDMAHLRAALDAIYFRATQK